jgi:hypothetical protein
VLGVLFCPANLCDTGIPQVGNRGTWLTTSRNSVGESSPEQFTTGRPAVRPPRGTRPTGTGLRPRFVCRRTAPLKSRQPPRTRAPGPGPSWPLWARFFAAGSARLRQRDGLPDIASSHLAAVAYRKSCGLPNIYRISSGKMLTKTGMARCFGVDLAHEVRKRERTDFLPS